MDICSFTATTRNVGEFIHIFLAVKFYRIYQSFFYLGVKMVLVEFKHRLVFLPLFLCILIYLYIYLQHLNTPAFLLGFLLKKLSAFVLDFLCFKFCKFTEDMAYFKFFILSSFQSRDNTAFTPVLNYL